MNKLFNGIYQGKTVLITGHTGFKGSWLSLWATRLGAKVVGYSLPAPTNPNHFENLKLDMVSVIGDIRDQDLLDKTFKEHKPDIVFHMAAQPLVRFSYKDPIETFETNVMGTLKVFEACRKCDSVRAIINVTSDKCYQNREWVWGYRENDPMGGRDPYSASKGCAELLASSYRDSYFNNVEYQKSHQTLLASVRSGNVIGGGDWAEDRLVPDIMRAVSANEKVEIRNPDATRPWQHVLEPLSGYLDIGQRLLEGKARFAEGWNFGPNDDRPISVKEVLGHIKEHWPAIKYEIKRPAGSMQLHEAGLLKLDCSKAHHKLQWKSVWDSSVAFEETVNWYKEYYSNKNIITVKNLDRYVKEAKIKGLAWPIGS